MAQQLWLPATWDRQVDVVVVGFGAAGAATAITAYDAGTTVILLDKAPQGHAGGNTRVAGQGYLNTSSVDKAMTYLHALCGPYRVPDPMVRVWAEEVGQNNAWVASLGGDPQEHQHPPVGIEFPELPGSDCVRKFHHGPVVGYSNTWDMLARAVRGRAIDMLYETPGKALIQDGVTQAILGVRAERDGKPCDIKASKAVVLTCGGFENNQEMIRTYLPGLPYCYPSGSPYNEGDGVTMLAKGWIRRAETLTALARTLGLPPAVLEETVTRWNAHCHAGADPDFGRTKMLCPIQSAPFYAIELSPSMLNTQGGPRRNARGQIVRPDGSPIPRLYSAGELGSIYSYLYQGTGNIGECLAFGRIAGRNAAAEQSWR